jgi:hypothetical protein
MTRENIVQIIGILVVLGTVALTIAGILYELQHM